MKKIISTLATILVAFSLSAQGLHIYKADGSYEILKAIDVDSIVFFNSAADAMYIDNFEIDNSTDRHVGFSARVMSDKDLPITECGFCWSTSNNPTINDSKVIAKCNGNVFEGQTSTCTNGQRYYFCPYVTWAYGTLYGQVKNIVVNQRGSSGTENGHAWVDLGLSVVWATCNIGATTPEGYGDYFAWGETSPKGVYNVNTYKWCNGSYETLTKYCTDSSDGKVDNKKTLDQEDDAAHVNWEGNWRMPTSAEIYELQRKENCTWTWTSNYNSTGVAGYIVSSNKNSNSIFFPASGYRSGSSLFQLGAYGGYWSASLLGNSSPYGDGFEFNSAYYTQWFLSCRDYGHSVRPVCP